MLLWFAGSDCVENRRWTGNELGASDGVELLGSATLRADQWELHPEESINTLNAIARVDCFLGHSGAKVARQHVQNPPQQTTVESVPTPNRQAAEVWCVCTSGAGCTGASNLGTTARCMHDWTSWHVSMRPLGGTLHRFPTPGPIFDEIHSPPDSSPPVSQCFSRIPHKRRSCGEQVCLGTATRLAYPPALDVQTFLWGELDAK